MKADKAIQVSWLPLYALHILSLHNYTIILFIGLVSFM